METVRQSMIFYEMSQLDMIGVFQRFLDQNPVIRVSLGVGEGVL